MTSFKRQLGPVAVTAQAIGTIGLTLTLAVVGTVITGGTFAGICTPPSMESRSRRLMTTVPSL